MAKDYRDELLAQLVEQVLQLQGSVLALKAINGAILNVLLTTQRDRQRIRGTIANLSLTVDFKKVNERPEAQTLLSESFNGCLRDVLNDLVVGDEHTTPPSPDT